MKRVAALRALSDDHHSALVLARRCERAAEEGVWQAVWRHVQDAFAAHLEPHFRIEEDHLLPGLEAIGEPALAERIREDHAALRALRDEAAPTAETVGELGGRLEDHVRFEERTVFESTQHRLPEATLRAVAEACEAVPRLCVPPPP